MNVRNLTNPDELVKLGRSPEKDYEVMGRSMETSL